VVPGDLTVRTAHDIRDRLEEALRAEVSRAPRRLGLVTRNLRSTLIMLICARDGHWNQELRLVLEG